MTRHGDNLEFIHLDSLVDRISKRLYCCIHHVGSVQIPGKSIAPG